MGQNTASRPGSSRRKVYPVCRVQTKSGVGDSHVNRMYLNSGEIDWS